MLTGQLGNSRHTTSAMDTSDELPRAVVKRIVKAKLQQLQTSLKSKNADSITISKV